MKMFFLLISLIFFSNVFSQEIQIDSKAYNILKSNGQINIQSEFSRNLVSQKVIHYTGSVAKTGICDCMIPLDSTFILAMLPNDDLSSNNIPLPFDFHFYGITYDSLYINNNGNVSFTMPYSFFTANSFPDPNFNMIAPFWADVDTRSANGGNVWYKLNPHSIVIVWDHVGYYSEKEDKLNTFQLIISDGQDSLINGGNNVAFCYGDMQWTTGEASAGINGFGGFPATTGVNIGNGVDYFQVGQFDTLGTAFDGPYNGIDQVDFLDNQEIYFNLASSSTNIPPLMVSSIICDTIDIYTGDTLHKSQYSIDFTIGVSTPEIGQLINTTIQCSLPSAFSYYAVQDGEYIAYNMTFDAVNVQPGMYFIDMDVTDNGIPAQTVHKTIPIRVLYDTNVSGLTHFEEEGIKLYPNPSSTWINLEGLQFDDQVCLIDLQGKTIFNGEVPTDKLDISHLDKGVYLLQVIRSGKHIQTVKMIKD
jgi:hypothetical protein